MLDGLLIAPETPPFLSQRDTRSVPGLELDKADAEGQLGERAARIELLQQRLFAEGDRALLVVLQGMDTSGKDGAIKKVFRGITPAAFQVATFKSPEPREQAQDFLWRVHAQCPRRGHIGIFNRSHYEDVIAARVRGGLPADRVAARYRHLNDFERLLTDEGTTVVKCFLHISEDEQRQRLQARLDDPEKRWKFRAGDLDDRRSWDDFHTAYEQTIAATSTEWAPWHVVPADRKWLRDVVVSEIVVRALERMDPKLPSDNPEVANLRIT